MSLVSEVQVQIDEAAGPVFWTLGQVYDAINAAQLDVFARARDAFFTYSTLTITASTDIALITNTLMFIPQYIITPENVQLFPTNQAQLQDWQDTWRNEPNAQPNWYVVWDFDHLRFWPPTDQQYLYTLYGVQWPTEIGTGAGDVQDVICDPLLRQAIIHFSVAYLLEYTQPQLGDTYMSEGEEHLRRYMRQARNSMGDNIWRLRPGKGWTIGQFGDIRIARKYSAGGMVY